MKKNIAILGSTGSIGKNTLNVVRHLKEDIQVKALAAHSQIDLLEKQIIEFCPDIVAVYNIEKAKQLRERLPRTCILEGMEGLKTVASYARADLVVAAISGTAGIIPTLEAVSSGKPVAIANKEALVSAGALITKRAQKTGSILLPIDSEHSAIFQCLQGQKKATRLVLTASGGPFLHTKEELLSNISIENALCHPNYTMGKKNTIDSSTLMNKGLEIIEAHWLFGMPVDQIDVVIHPEQIIHSMVEFTDGSTLAQLSEPTMLIPIQYALTYPRRMPSLSPPFDWTKHRSLHFMPPDFSKFRCLQLAYDALRAGESYPCYLNSANEILVQRFINNHISWLEIPHKLEKLLDQHKAIKIVDIEEVINIDAQARKDAAII